MSLLDQNPAVTLHLIFFFESMEQRNILNKMWGGSFFQRSSPKRGLGIAETDSIRMGRCPWETPGKEIVHRREAGLPLGLGGV